MKRVIAYVDGFNVYKGIQYYRQQNPNKLPSNKIDLRSLITNHLIYEGESLESICWYSAIPNNDRDPEKQRTINNHKQYKNRLENDGVHIRLSGYRKRSTKCSSCGHKTRSSQEKETDNRLSLEVLEDAVFDRMDRALIISSDSDFIPVLHSLNRYRERREVDAVMCPPIGRDKSAKAVIEKCRELFGTTERRMYPNTVSQYVIIRPRI